MDIITSNKFDKSFLKLPVKIRLQFKERLNIFTNNPQNSVLIIKFINVQDRTRHFRPHFCYRFWIG